MPRTNRVRSALRNYRTWVSNNVMRGNRSFGAQSRSMRAGIRRLAGTIIARRVGSYFRRR